MDLKRACEVWDFLANEYAEKTGEDIEPFNVRMDSKAMLACLRAIRWAVTDEISEGGSTGYVRVRSFNRDAGRYCQGSIVEWKNPSEYPRALAKAVDSAIIALEKERLP